MEGDSSFYDELYNLLLMRDLLLFPDSFRLESEIYREFAQNSIINLRLEPDNLHSYFPLSAVLRSCADTLTQPIFASLSAISFNAALRTAHFLYSRLGSHQGDREGEGALFHSSLSFQNLTCALHYPSNTLTVKVGGFARATRDYTHLTLSPSFPHEYYLGPHSRFSEGEGQEEVEEVEVEEGGAPPTLVFESAEERLYSEYYAAAMVALDVLLRGGGVGGEGPSRSLREYIQEKDAENNVRFIGREVHRGKQNRIGTPTRYLLEDLLADIRQLYAQEVSTSHTLQQTLAVIE